MRGETAHDSEYGWEREEQWRVVDRELRTIATRRAALDAEEARWLRRAEALRLWWHFGMVSAFDYMERALGYTPHVAKEKLRVARALGDLPAIEEALSEGAVSYSAVRELTRVATPETEDEWLDAADGKNVREIEELVAAHRVGDRPSDPKDERVRVHRFVLEVSAETYAALRQARIVLDEEHGSRLDDNQLGAALAAAVLDGGGERAPTQVAVTVCEKCKSGWQHGGGATVAISTAAVERAECDAVRVGSIDADEPGRAVRDIPPATARLVRHRDRGRCRVPGCRSARGLELHHLVRRADGGSHDPSNLVLLCSSCHIAHHDGRLTITGTADALEVRRVQSHVGLNPSLRHDAKLALQTLGWKPKIAAAATDAALEELGDAPLESIVRAALRYCAREHH